MASHLQRASALFQLRRYADAERELRSALVEHPDDATAHSMLGIALSHLHRLREAADEAEEGIERNPSQPYAFYAHSLVMIRSSRHAAALSSIREAIRLDPVDVDYLVILAALLYDKQLWYESLDALNRGLAASPQHVRSLNLRGKVLRQLDRWEEASRSFDAALEIDPENADSHHARGALLLARGESEAAVEHLLEARRLDPVSKNDADAIAVAVGRQLPPFRWLARHNLHWHLWRPKATWAFFMALVLVYMGLNFAFPHNKDGSRPAWYFGLATLNLLLLPISSGFLSTGAALLFKRRMIGAPWYKPFMQIPMACWPVGMHLLVTGIATQPPLTMFALAIGSCTCFVVGLNQSLRDGSPLSILFVAYGVLLAVLACLTTLFLDVPKTDTFTALGVFALPSFFSDNVARALRPFER